MRRAGLAVLLTALIPGQLWAQDPLSAIDWLSQSVEPAASAPPGGTRDPIPDPDEAPVTDSAAAPEITTRPLDRVLPDALGLLPGSVTGLPPTLWQNSETETLALLIRADSLETLPALRDLSTTLLLAQAEAPQGSSGNAFFLARVDRLLDMGALEPAQALLDLTTREDPEIFRRWFDVTLLTGTEDQACRFLEERPSLAPTWPARIFCLSRRGDWTAAALTLGTARSLGEISPAEDRLLSRFLDAELAEEEDLLPPPDRPSPLVYRLREAIGDPLTTATLPRAFAHADLRPMASWRSQMEAAERLSRAGAVPPNVLFALYTREVPAASGGIWDRARAIQTLEAAFAQGPEAVAAALPQAWQAMAVPRAEVAFAEFYTDRIRATNLTGSAGELAFRIALLSGDYEKVARDAPEGTALLAGIARGEVSGLEATNNREEAVLVGFDDAEISATMAALLQEDRLGEALLRLLGAMSAGLESDPQAVTEGIAVLRRVGLEDVARRTALQYLILPGRI